MKRLALILALLPLGLQAQTADSAEAVVERYLTLMNYDALPQDSMLVLETTVTFHGSRDTVSLRRWYAAPTMERVEVWHGDTLVNGLCTNGSSRYREYRRRMDWWEDVPHDLLLDKMNDYDFRGPLYRWRQHEIKFTYQGITTAKGQRLNTVHAEQPGHYTRQYFFEEHSGLLVVIREEDDTTALDETQQILKQFRVKPIDYKIVHEYLPVGEMLVPTQESYMRDGLLTIMETKASLVPRDNIIFNQD